MLAGAAAAVIAAAAPLDAQQASVLVGGAYARYADTVSGSAGAVAGRLEWESARTRVGFEGSLSQFTAGAWAAQSAGSFFGVALARGGWAAGVTADGRASAVEGGTWSGAASVGGTAALSARRWLLLADATAGVVRRVDETTDNTFGSGLRLRREGTRWSVEAELSGIRAGSVAFADLTLALRLHGERLGVGVLGGARSGDLADDPWIQGFAELRVARWLQLECSAGSYPRDLSGFATGSFVSVGARVGGAAYRPVRPAGWMRGRSPHRAVVIERASADLLEVTFLVRDASQVAIAGEWNARTPEPLVPVGDGRWRAVLRLRTGAYRFSLVVNGDRWLVPSGVPTLPDDFGGSVGLLVVEN